MLILGHGIHTILLAGQVWHRHGLLTYLDKPYMYISFFSDEQDCSIYASILHYADIQVDACCNELAAQGFAHGCPGLMQ